MMWDRLKTPLLALSVCLNAAFFAFWLAQALPGLNTGPDVMEGVVDDIAGLATLHREIGVTPEQWMRIEPYVLHFREESEGQLRILGGLHDQLMDLLAAAEIDEPAIRAKQEEIVAGQRQMQDLVFELLYREKEILTLEQRRELLRAIHQSCTVAAKSCSQTDGSAQ